MDEENEESRFLNKLARFWEKFVESRDLEALFQKVARIKYFRQLPSWEGKSVPENIGRS